MRSAPFLCNPDDARHLADAICPPIRITPLNFLTMLALAGVICWLLARWGHAELAVAVAIFWAMAVILAVSTRRLTALSMKRSLGRDGDKMFTLEWDDAGYRIVECEDCRFGWEELVRLIETDRYFIFRSQWRICSIPLEALSQSARSDIRDRAANAVARHPTLPGHSAL